MNLSPRVLKICAYVCAALLSLSLVLGVTWIVSQQRAVASGYYIRLNGPCVGQTATKTYDGVWKKLGDHKAKCREGAGGPAGEIIQRSVCRIVTINDGIFDNATVTSSQKCRK